MKEKREVDPQNGGKTVYIDLESVPVYVINLLERPERMVRTAAELSHFGIEKYNRVEGQKMKTPSIGICRSHQDCVRSSQANSDPWACVVEDDVHFVSPGSRLHADRALASAPSDADLLLGGIYYGDVEPYNEYWDLVKGPFSALHFYLVNERAYDKFLEHDGKDTPLDYWLGQNMKCYVSRPFFAIQHPGYSDNVKSDVDYMFMLSKYSILDRDR